MTPQHHAERSDRGRDPTEVVAAVWRLESARLVGALLRMVRDLALAEDLAQEALVAALEQWPRGGVPGNPGAWLMTVAKRRAVDHFRRAERQSRGQQEIAGTAERPASEADLDALVDHIEDDVLRLMFVACHPVLTPESRVTLTLRLVGGLTTVEIARSFLTKPATVGQRISRAKRQLSAGSVDLEVPTGRDRHARLSSVTEVIYLIFNEGYTASAGDDWMRPALCEEARRLARMLGRLLPREPEVHGLQALLDLQASRIPARTGPTGEVVLLADQDRRHWDGRLVRQGLDALTRANRLAAQGAAIGPLVLQAEIAACHARARSVEDTDWRRVADLYDLLAATAPSPVVELNRAVAHSMAFGPQQGLDILDAVDAPALGSYHLLPSVRGDLLARLGRTSEAAAEFRRAASLARNSPERTLLEERADRLSSH